MAGLLARIERAKRPLLHALSPARARLAYDAGAEVLDFPRVPLPRVEDFSLAGRPARLYAPASEGAARLPLMLYLHGGGFVIGSPRFERQVAAMVGRRTWKGSPGRPRKETDVGEQGTLGL